MNFRHHYHHYRRYHNRYSLLIGLLFCSLAVHAKDAAVVVGKSTPVNALHSADIAKAVKGTTHKMANGKAIVIVTKAAKSDETRIFGEKCLGENPTQLAAMIASEHAIFRIVDTDEDVLKAVNAIPGSIGLVDVYSINSSVTVVKLDDKSPLEPGYLLHGN